jgi:hypothetical protein
MIDYTKKRKVILDCQKKFKSTVFVETGTFLGGTTSALKGYFTNIYTIELHKRLLINA